MKNGGGGAPENKLLKGKFLGFALGLLRFKRRILLCPPEGENRRIYKNGAQEILHFVQNDMSFKIGTNTCHPEDEVRRISKKNERGVFRFAQNDKKCAFTLAEVLITLGIIGIIAAMTLPALVGKYKKLVTVTKLKKVYTTLSQMVMQSQEDNGPASFSTDAKIDADVVETFFNMYWKPYFNNTNVYRSLAYGKTMPYTLRDGRGYNLSVYTAYSVGRVLFSTNDGTMYLLAMLSWDTEYDEEGNPIVVHKYAPLQTIYVDIDGIKGENTFGKDLFMFVIDFDNNVVKPYGYDKSNNSVNTDCIRGTGTYCAAKIMNDGWEIKDDYPW